MALFDDLFGEENLSSLDRRAIERAREAGIETDKPLDGVQRAAILRSRADEPGSTTLSRDEIRTITGRDSGFEDISNGGIPLLKRFGPRETLGGLREDRFDGLTVPSVPIPEQSSPVPNVIGRQQAREALDAMRVPKVGREPAAGKILEEMGAAGRPGAVTDRTGLGAAIDAGISTGGPLVTRIPRERYPQEALDQITRRETIELLGGEEAARRQAFISDSGVRMQMRRMAKSLEEAGVPREQILEAAGYNAEGKRSISATQAYRNLRDLSKSKAEPKPDRLVSRLESRAVQNKSSATALEFYTQFNEFGPDAASEQKLIEYLPQSDQRRLNRYFQDASYGATGIREQKNADRLLKKATTLAERSVQEREFKDAKELQDAKLADIEERITDKQERRQFALDKEKVSKLYKKWQDTIENPPRGVGKEQQMRAIDEAKAAYEAEFVKLGATQSASERESIIQQFMDANEGISRERAEALAISQGHIE